MKTIVSIMLFLICALHGNAANNKATLEVCLSVDLSSRHNHKA